ncbi:hypothetical protein J5837_14995 [Pseudoxanthomonas helianthi]|uniref:Secreted protein n=1 Tax=Pseudoxanthomonas helianthi TaxID=1453541 RepID=A0A940X5R6_9GAMM|nr:hypothetical protein [Pseudoxanthomonas helianthi]MBP3985716.1 hypothetical protein [Pseudoxanthomonas helianthi]
MHKVFSKYGATLLFSIMALWFAFPESAHAEREKSYNLIVFDANMNIIGQHAEYCNNYQYEGGDLNGPNMLVVEGGCGNYVVSCGYDSGWTVYSCEGVGYDYALVANFYGTSTGYNVGHACNISGACSDTEPTLMSGHGLTLIRIYPPL